MSQTASVVSPPSRDAEKARDRRMLLYVAVIGVVSALTAAIVGGLAGVKAANDTVSKEAKNQRTEAQDEFLREQRISSYKDYLDSEAAFTTQIYPSLQKIITMGLATTPAAVSLAYLQDQDTAMTPAFVDLESKWTAVKLVASKPVIVAGQKIEDSAEDIQTLYGELESSLINVGEPNVDSYFDTLNEYINDPSNSTSDADEAAFESAIQNELGDH